jgi:hypothetical protein
MLNRSFLQWVLANGRLQQVPKTLVDSGRNENSAFYLFLDLLETQRNPSLSDLRSNLSLPAAAVGRCGRAGS